jgi:LytR cell envelope-related transcriptional attenuator
VAVLNASTIPGVARAAAERLVRAGYTPGTVTNEPPSRQLSLVLYAPGARPAAVAIAGESGSRAGRRSTRRCARGSAARPASP